MKFEFKVFSDLSVDELYEILKLRSEIFVVEQNCVYNDLDDLDKKAVHVFLIKGGEIVACARLLEKGARYPDFSIGRVVVKKTERKTGIGKAIMEASKKYIFENFGSQKIKISAQQYLQRFYEDLGFIVFTEMYLEDGIPHVGMIFKNE